MLVTIAETIVGLMDQSRINVNRHQVDLVGTLHQKHVLKNTQFFNLAVTFEISNQSHFTSLEQTLHDHTFTLSVKSNVNIAAMYSQMPVLNCLT